MKRKVILLLTIIFLIFIVLFISTNKINSSTKNNRREILITQSKDEPGIINIKNNSKHRVTWEESQTKVYKYSKKEWVPIDIVLPKIVNTEYIDGSSSSNFSLDSYLTDIDSKKLKVIFYFSYTDKPKFSQEIEVQIPSKN